MQPKNSMNNQKMAARSFIEASRRAQIIEATIRVLAERGYTNASFVRIGEQAGITPSLISYHFTNKSELMTATLDAILTKRAATVKAELKNAVNATEKLRIAIEADLDTMAANLHEFKALAEIIFTIRSEEGTLTYLGQNETDLFNLTYEILEEGRRTGEFIEGDMRSMAIIIDGARDSFLAQLGLRRDFAVESFKKTLIATAMAAVKKEKTV